MSETIEIDGSQGEGGGQILRTSLALAALTGRPVHFTNIRAGRAKSGLLRQHLTCVEAAAAICDGRLTGAALRASEVTFEPGALRGGEWRFPIGTAGSTGLVLQTVLPVLLAAPGPSKVIVEGGTHNSMAPCFDFLARVFAPLVTRMGARLELTLERHGFQPAGGGRVVATIQPGPLHGIDLLERGALRKRRARALVSKLPASIGERELRTVRDVLGWHQRECEVEEVDAQGTGNVLLLEVEHDACSELVTGFGEQGVAAERVANGAARELRGYLDSGLPVGEHLADQLMIPMALAGGGRYRSVPLSLHSTTNIMVIKRFLEVGIEVREIDGGVEVGFSR